VNIPEKYAIAPCGQSISKKRPSRFVILSVLCHPEPRFVILSEAKDLGPARDPSLRSEPALSAAKDDTPASASFDAHIVFFEMDCPLWAPKAGSQG
jgi:hypothetical protein